MELYSYLLTEVFQGFIQRHPELLSAIEDFEGELTVSNDTLVFSIPALFEFVCIAYERSSGHRVRADRKSYLRFRKSLYSNPTNDLLRERGGRVEIESANKDLNLSISRLVRHERTVKC